MTSINLYQEKQEEQKTTSIRAANGGLFLSIGLLVATIATLVGFKIAVSNVNAKNEQTLSDADQANVALKGEGDLSKVVDLQTRLEQIKTNLVVKDGKVQRLGMDDILDKLAKTLNSEIVVSDYLYDGKKVKLTYTALNFDDAAKQLLVFKQSDFFTNVVMTEIGRGERFVSVKLTMDIK